MGSCQQQHRATQKAEPTWWAKGDPEGVALQNYSTSQRGEPRQTQHHSQVSHEQLRRMEIRQDAIFLTLQTTSSFKTWALTKKF